MDTQFEINLNATGTHKLTITSRHLQTISRYSLLDGIIDSNGYVDDNVLQKLRANAASIICSAKPAPDDLLELASDVIFRPKMKAYGLGQLVALYKSQKPAQAENRETEDAPAQ